MIEITEFSTTFITTLELTWSIIFSHKSLTITWSMLWVISLSRYFHLNHFIKGWLITNVLILTNGMWQTKAAKHALGRYYREPKTSGAIPIHLVESLVASIKKDHYVSDTGDIVFYETDPDLYVYASVKSKIN